MSTQTNQTLTSVNMKDIKDFNIPNLMDLAPKRLVLRKVAFTISFNNDTLLRV